MALNQLLDAISIYTQQQDRREEREQDLLEKQINKTYAESQMWLQNSLDTLQYQRQLKDQYVKEASDLGILSSDLLGIDPENITSGGEVLFGHSRSDLENKIKVNDEQIKSLANSLSVYNRGTQYAKMIDTGGLSTPITQTDPDTGESKVVYQSTPDGRVSEEELTAFLSNEELVTGEWENLIENPIFRHGIAGASLAPSQVLDLQAKTVALAGEQMKLDHLPEALKLDIIEQKTRILKGKLDIKDKEETINQRRKEFKVWEEVTVPYMQLQYNELEQVVNQRDYEINKQMYDDWNISMEKYQTSNIEEQNQIGTYLLSNLYLNLGDGSTMHMFDLLRMASDDTVEGQAMFADWTNKLSESTAPGISLIKGDMLGLINTFMVGKATTVVNDYDPVLEDLGLIYKDWLEYKEFLANGAFGKPQNQDELFKNMEAWGEEQGINVLRYMKAVQWENAGLFTGENLNYIAAGSQLVGRLKNSRALQREHLIKWNAFSEMNLEDNLANKKSSSVETLNLDVEEFSVNQLADMDSIISGLSNNGVTLSQDSKSQLKKGIITDEVVDGLQQTGNFDSVLKTTLQDSGFFNTNYNLDLAENLNEKEQKEYSDIVDKLVYVKGAFWKADGTFDPDALLASEWAEPGKYSKDGIKTQKQLVNYVLKLEKLLRNKAGVDDNTILNTETVKLDDQNIEGSLYDAYAGEEEVDTSKSAIASLLAGTGVDSNEALLDILQSRLNKKGGTGQDPTIVEILNLIRRYETGSKKRNTDARDIQSAIDKNRNKYYRDIAALLKRSYFDR